MTAFAKIRSLVLTAALSLGASSAGAMIGGGPTTSQFEVFFDNCTGTMIAPNVILTAGHCVFGPHADGSIASYYKRDADIMVQSYDGKNAQSGFKRTFILKVYASVPHPLWAAAMQNASNGSADAAADSPNVADVGVIVLEQRLPLAKVQLPEADLLKNSLYNSTEIVWMGAGCQERGDDRTMGTLKKAVTPILNAGPSRILMGTSDQLTHAVAGPCKRDSGGGAFILKADGTEPDEPKQIAVCSIMAGSDADALASAPTNFFVSRIDRADVLSWLQQIVRAAPLRASSDAVDAEPSASAP